MSLPAMTSLVDASRPDAGPDPSGGPGSRDKPCARPGAGTPDRSWSRLALVGGLLVVAIIALLNVRADRRLAFGLLYFLPIAAVAWRGGLAHGLLVSLASSLAWHVVDALEYPADHLVVRLINWAIRFGVFAITSSLLSRLRSSIHREQVLARTDPLTGAVNCRTFHESIAAEAERSLRTGQPLSLAYVDLDYFKQLNDRLGHLTGDEALFFLVRTIRQDLRNADVIARLGGDEFGLLLPNTTAEGAVTMLSRLQRFLSQEMARKGWPVTLSIGAATFLRPPRHVAVMIHHVDTLMYRVKRNGRNQILHETVAELTVCPELHWAQVERRADKRVPCQRLARVSVEQRDAFAEEMGTVRDISHGGIGLHLERQLPLETLVTIEILNSQGPCILLARVMRTAVREGGWLHGCKLSWVLSDEDLQGCLEERSKEGKPCL